ncbi:hypothetical protein SDC9_177741 [bioreactor metagenome]|uniref:Uncharacterized protein n=1 Tax=bioreactor metagenome TaxID=1076179 RepID=A0A645GTX0_9ZZZZ
MNSAEILRTAVRTNQFQADRHLAVAVPVRGEQGERRAPFRPAENVGAVGQFQNPAFAVPVGVDHRIITLPGLLQRRARKHSGGQAEQQRQTEFQLHDSRSLFRTDAANNRATVWCWKSVSVPAAGGSSHARPATAH